MLFGPRLDYIVGSLVLIRYIIFAMNYFVVKKKVSTDLKNFSLKEAQQHGKTLKLIYWSMRAFLRIFGPNRFYDLSKLMVYLSIIRKQNEFWNI